MNKKILAFLISLNFLLTLWGVTISEIENAYIDGDLHINHNFLRISASDNPDLLACKLFYNAKLNTLLSKGKTYYSQSYQKSPKSKYGQLSNMELAKLDFFNRDYENALEKLKNIDLITERYYWQARVYFLQKKWAHTIICAENYLDNEENGDFSLELRALLLDVYLVQNNLNAFLAVKEKMHTSSNFSDLEAYALYKEGLLYEKQNELSKANETLRLIVDKYPKSQYRVYADDLILDYNKRMQQTVKPAIAETETNISQPQIPKSGGSKKHISFSELEKGKSYLQYGLFSTPKAAENYKQQLESRGISLFVITKTVNDKEYFALIQGPFTSKESANTFLTNVKNNNINAFLFIP